MLQPRSRFLVGALAACCLLASATNSLACKVPVFRYALEHWNPDSYRAVILHNGPLSASDEALAAKFEARTSVTSSSVNVVVDRIDVSNGTDPISLLAETLGDDYRNIKTPQIALYYPQHSRSGPLAWRGALSAENIDALLDSPARQQIAKWILAGESAVWILVGSGDNKQDTAAETALRNELARLEKEVKLADIEVIKAEKQFGDDTKVDLRLGFKLLVLDRNDPKEKILAETLLRSEDDLLDLKEPVAIPVFGRGRSHLALVGKGINPTMIEESCRFLAGDCSCEVKRQNPGVDLVFDVKWDDLVVGAVDSEQALPALSGVGLYNEITLEDASATADSSTDSSNSSTGKQESELKSKPTATTTILNARRKSTEQLDRRGATQPSKRTQPSDSTQSTEDQKLAYSKTDSAKPATNSTQPATRDIAHSSEVSVLDTDTDNRSANGVVDAPPARLGERLMLWITGIAALGMLLVIASTLWLRSQASQR